MAFMNGKVIFASSAVRVPHQLVGSMNLLAISKEPTVFLMRYCAGSICPALPINPSMTLTTPIPHLSDAAQTIAMSDATAFGKWNAARRLLERGAAATLFDACCLGLVTDVEHALATAHPTPENATSSFLGACHGGQIRTASVLLDHGADIKWVGYDGLSPLDAARRSEADDVCSLARTTLAASTGPADSDS